MRKGPLSDSVSPEPNPKPPLRGGSTGERLDKHIEDKKSLSIRAVNVVDQQPDLSWSQKLGRSFVWEELRRLAGRKGTIPRWPRQPEAQWQLRMKFLERAKSYIGVPYAKKYHLPGTPESESLLFLDCCGLIRRVVQDLMEDFGFYIGPGNQAYQYDTLPITLPSEEHLKPGDLVFISGTYFDPQRTRQAHDIVHVEIWLGEEERSLGARWKTGKVQIFDSYQFVSKTYGDIKYHFKSIETWLQGTCVRSSPGA
ncbi:uncharacterized protein LOC132587316 [Heteronotia binoei]|uniref:uncharacterized protein LOC132587316 n=1 Tax=Heteronotia binoei TaxID=13085 RepID=UPI00292D587A|nr:uncharacterized protein LOC132587316 [Heteronotia binoei]